MSHQTGIAGQYCSSYSFFRAIEDGSMGSSSRCFFGWKTALAITEWLARSFSLKDPHLNDLHSAA